MAVDLEKVLRAALEAALDDGAEPRHRPRRTGDHRADEGRHHRPAARRRSGARSVLMGAGLVTAGRMLVRRRGQRWLAALEARLDDDEAGPVQDRADRAAAD